ncbi:MAG TPA: hypothetical protein PKL52_00580 [Tenuifilaceae bacterium]|nr:hypothetical protein [Tenuifilaceae bacterium]
MSDIEKAETPQEQSREEINHLSSSIPKSKMKGVLEEFEMFALQRGSQSSFDISTFNETQKDKLLDILSTNEKNAFDFHTKRIDAIKEIEVKKIDASIVNQKSLRIIIIAIVITIPAITLIILFFKETFFIPWLTFLTGLIGGVGISKIIPVFYKQPSKENPINDNSDN